MTVNDGNTLHLQPTRPSQWVICQCGVKVKRVEISLDPECVLQAAVGLQRQRDENTHGNSNRCVAETAYC